MLAYTHGSQTWSYISTNLVSIISYIEKCGTRGAKFLDDKKKFIRYYTKKNKWRKNNCQGYLANLTRILLSECLTFLIKILTLTWLFNLKFNWKSKDVIDIRISLCTFQMAKLGKNISTWMAKKSLKCKFKVINKFERKI